MARPRSSRARVARLSGLGRRVIRERASRAARSVRALGRKAQGWNLDLVITDFEPISCHVGHNLNLPILVIDNQHLLTDTEMRYPREYRK
ncbi:MAG TPA: glycosyltransferase family protein, partial [Terriglobales bacterium]|nr:glycosyltransferase family protein [Terriglobales bacterium]